MSKHTVIIIKIAFIICYLTLASGCDNKAESPQTSKVTTQKIAVAKKIAKPAPSDPAARPAPLVKKPDKVSAAQNTKSQVGATPPVSTKPEPAVKIQVPEKVEQKPAVESAKAIQTTPVPGVKDAYNPEGKIDPFTPLFEEKPVVAAEKKKQKRRMPLTPLERVDLSQLKLVGIIRAPSGNKALVEQASGKGYIIKKGTFIGIHAGRVLEILKDRIVVEEEVENVLGQFTLEKRELKLQKPPGEF